MVEMKPPKEWDLIGSVDASEVLEFNDDLDELIIKSISSLKDIESVLSDRYSVLDASLDPRLSNAVTYAKGAFSNAQIARVKLVRILAQLNDMNQIIDYRNESVKNASKD